VAGWGSLGQTLRQRYSAANNIHFHGALFGERKEKLMREVDVLIVPSLWPEVFGIVVAEAYAFGKPVLASRIGGLPESVRQGETGYLFSPGNGPELTTLLHDLVSNPERIRGLTDLCFAEAERYSREEIFSQYLALYEMLNQ
jgi:glycosyltransferase involved in cell wall biosynthesis